VAILDDLVYKCDSGADILVVRRELSRETIVAKAMEGLSQNSGRAGIRGFYSRQEEEGERI
jgi:hypothetical protein